MSEEKIEQAETLIADEQYDAAVALLEEVLRSDRENLEAWWLMANAVDSPDEAREALQIVLDLDPSHQEAREMLDQLNEMYPTEEADLPEPEPTVEDEVEAAPAGDAEPDWLAMADESPREMLAESEVESVFDGTSAFDREAEDTSTFGEFDFLEDDDFFDELDEEDFGFEDEDEVELDEEDFEFEEEEKPPKRSRRRLFVLLGLLVVVIAIAAVVLIVPNLLGGGGPAPTPAPPGDDATVETLRQNYADTLAALGEALGDAGLQEPAADFRVTSAGPTLMGTFCWTERRGWPEAALEAMGILTQEAEPMAADGLAAVGVEMRRCGEETVVFARATDLSQAIDYYINQDSTVEDFQATWTEP